MPGAVARSGAGVERARCMLGRESGKAARVRTLLERLDEQRLRGNTKALIEDIIAIERAGKFKQRQTLFHFLRDLVHSLRWHDVITD